MHCSLCVLYPTQLKGTLKNLLLLQIDYFHLSLSLSWLVPILLFATSEAWGNQRITEKAQPLVTSIIPLCCVVPDTVNDNQWTNNNLAGLIMQNHVNTTVSHTLVNMSILHSGVSSWKRNNSVYYNINIKSGFIQNPKLIQREENFTIFRWTQKAWCFILKEQNFFNSNLYPIDTYPPSFQITKIRYRVYPFPQIIHIKKITSCLPIIK